MRLRKWNPASLVVTAMSAAVAALIGVPAAEARPWNEHSSHLAMLARQMEMNENEIHALIEQKRHTEDLKHIAEIMQSIAERHRALEKAAKEYEEERQHVRFEHPERNDQLNREYVRHEVKSIEEMDNGLSIDARLDRARAAVLAKFPVPEKKMTADEKNFRTRLPASKKDVADEDAPEKIKLVK